MLSIEKIGGTAMSLTPPSLVTFFLAVLLAVFSLLVRYTNVDIPVVSGHSYETLLGALLLLLAGNVFRGF
jgi:hypothetical protein